MTKKNNPDEAKKSPAKTTIQIHPGMTQFESRTVEISEDTVKAIARVQGSSGAGPDDVIFARAMPLLGKKIKVKSTPKKAPVALNLPLAVWRFIDTAQKDNGCDTDAVLARIIEDK